MGLIGPHPSQSQGFARENLYNGRDFAFNSSRVVGKMISAVIARIFHCTDIMRFLTNMQTPKCLPQRKYKFVERIIVQS